MQHTQLLSTAFAHHQAGRPEQAEPIYRQILAAEPAQPDALHLLGVLCLQSGRGDEAIELLGRALAARPNHADTANHLGAAYGMQKRYDEAVSVLRRAVTAAPQDAGAHYNLGTALRNAGKLDEAVTSFRHAVAANPHAAEAHYNLGNTYRELKKLNEAEISFRHALAARPNYLKAMINLGSLLRDRKQYPESIALLEQAVALAPDHALAHMNLGTVLRDARQFDKALAPLERAVQLNPESAEAHNNLGTALQSLARFDEAGRCYDEALRLDPDLADAHFSRATWRLRNGDLAGGFEEYEWRWKCATFSDRGFPQPRWQGEPLDGRKVLLYGEQGMGDTLHFVRYAENAKRLGGHVIVECHEPLLAVLAGCPWIDELIPFNTPLPQFDTHAPLLSLPGILKLPEGRLWNGPYLTIGGDLVEQWRARLREFEGFRVGICWQGNPNHLFDAQRTVPLSTFEPLARVPGVRLFSLQYGVPVDAAARAEQGVDFEVIDVQAEYDQQRGAFVDAAAVMKNLDLVVTVDTVVAHLAGGLGVPTWVAMSAHPDWRWMLDREDSPWYPSVRLFRQSELDRWDDVFARMASRLTDLASTKP